MKAVHFNDLKATAYTSRAGSSGIKVILEGSPKDPDNFGLYLQQIDDSFSTPRHRHNFDQFRIAIKNPYNIGPKLDIAPGEFAYFPEGAHYGPQSGTSGTVVLTLQFTGASRSRYLNFDDLMKGHQQLKDRGTFHDGVFTDVTPAGTKRNRDSYEAIWENLEGKELQYPRPRYTQPVKIESEDFNWVPRERGVRTKHLGTFTEYEAGIGMLQLDDGAKATVGVADHRTVVFVRDGSVSCNGGQYETFSGLLLDRNETCQLEGHGGATLIQFTLPRLPQ